MQDLLPRLALDALGGQVHRVHVHLDLDVLDPTAVSPANEFAPEGGLSAAELGACIRRIREHPEIGSATVASYDPSFDHERHVLEAGMAFARLLST